MLNTLKNRLPDGMGIKKVKEKTSKYEITFVVYGKEYKSELTKTCAPGYENHVADSVICNVMCAAEIDNGNIQTAKSWLDKITHRSSE